MLKPSQLDCYLRDNRDVKIQTLKHLQTLPQMQKELHTQAQTRSRATWGAEMASGVREVDSSDKSSAGAAVPIMPGRLGNFSGLKLPARSKRIHQPGFDAARCQMLDMPACVGQAVPSSCCDQSQLVRSLIETPRELRPALQEECSSCRPRTRQFPLLMRQDELAPLVTQQALPADASKEDWQVPSLRLTSQEFEVWFQPGPLGVYVSDVQTGHVTEVFDGQVKAQGIRPGFQLLTLDGEPYSEALLERKVSSPAPYRVVFKQLLEQPPSLAPVASAAFPCRVPSLTSYVAQTDVLRGCQSFGTHALNE